MYANPHEVVDRACKSCGRIFQAPRYFNKEYCSVTCRRRYKAQRAVSREREDGIISTQAEQSFDDRFFVTITNPSVIELEKYSELTLSGLTKDKPIRIFGELPYFQTPTGITIAEQFGVEPRQWLMMKREPVSSLVDMLSSSSPL